MKNWDDYFKDVKTKKELDKIYFEIFRNEYRDEISSAYRRAYDRITDEVFADLNKTESTDDLDKEFEKHYLKLKNIYSDKRKELVAKAKPETDNKAKEFGFEYLAKENSLQALNTYYFRERQKCIDNCEGEKLKVLEAVYKERHDHLIRLLNRETAINSLDINNKIKNSKTLEELEKVFDDNYYTIGTYHEIQLRYIEKRKELEFADKVKELALAEKQFLPFISFADGYSSPLPAVDGYGFPVSITSLSGVENCLPLSELEKLCSPPVSPPPLLIPKIGPAISKPEFLKNLAKELVDNDVCPTPIIDEEKYLEYLENKSDWVTLDNGEEVDLTTVDGRAKYRKQLEKTKIKYEPLKEDKNKDLVNLAKQIIEKSDKNNEPVDEEPANIGTENPTAQEKTYHTDKDFGFKFLVQCGAKTLDLVKEGDLKEYCNYLKTYKNNEINKYDIFSEKNYNIVLEDLRKNKVTGFDKYEADGFGHELIYKVLNELDDKKSFVRVHTKRMSSQEYNKAFDLAKERYVWDVFKTNIINKFLFMESYKKQLPPVFEVEIWLNKILNEEKRIPEDFKEKLKATSSILDDKCFELFHALRTDQLSMLVVNKAVVLFGLAVKKAKQLKPSKPPIEKKPKENIFKNGMFKRNFDE